MKQRIFGEVKLVCILQWWTRHHKFFETSRMNNPKVDHKVNYQLLLIIMCKYGFICCNKCTPLQGDHDKG